MVKHQCWIWVGWCLILCLNPARISSGTHVDQWVEAKFWTGLSGLSHFYFHIYRGHWSLCHLGCRTLGKGKMQNWEGGKSDLQAPRFESLGKWKLRVQSLRIENLRKDIMLPLSSEVWALRKYSHLVRTWTQGTCRDVDLAIHNTTSELWDKLWSLWFRDETCGVGVEEKWPPSYEVRTRGWGFGRWNLTQGFGVRGWSLGLREDTKWTPWSLRAQILGSRLTTLTKTLLSLSLLHPSP